MKIKVLELFGGIGAPRKALENIVGEDKIKHIDYVEIKDFAILAYNNLFDNNYKAQSVIDWDLNVDILIHGSPCQDFSSAGNNDITTGRSILYNETLDIIENRLNVRPKVVIWENVKGLLNKNNVQHFNHYLDKMASFGYTNHYKVLNSKDFGIPQSRNRVFVVSILKGQEKFNNNFDFEKLENSEMQPLSSFLEKQVDNSYFITQKSMIEAIKNGKCKILDENSFCETITTKQIRWNNAGMVKIPILNEPIEGAEIFHIEGKPYHLRVLTPKECWKLMGFKDQDFSKIEHLMSSSKLYDLAGNSIVVQVLEAIFKELLEAE